ncbi:MAG: DNA-processing protein DprA [Deltaproteobacteria bacterium]|nr:DNA-processing protein DprA [Deltaproteobacteria bacterium]
MDRGRLRYWLALGRVKGLLRREIKDALATVLDAGDFFSPRQIDNAAANRAREAAIGFKDWKAVDKELDLLEKHGARIITFKDSDYPALLKEIDSPPPFLYAKGRSAGADFAAVAVVGTRTPSRYGLAASETIARDLASSGVTVVSGLARGCDTAAHKGSLAANGYTIAVLGTGIDIVYPRENKALFDEIAEDGLIVTEYSFSTPPQPGNFPARNRIISGISLGVIVCEAPLKSGAMMTAKLALESGREVFAVPGNATSDKSSGSNKLIKDGAYLAENARDVLEVLFPGKSFAAQTGGAKHATSTESADERKLLKALEDEALHIDAIAELAGLSAQKASALLLEMELKGLVEKLPGMRFARKIQR